MANIKSQKKRAMTNAKKNVVNHSMKSELKTAVKRVLAACVAKDKAAAEVAFNTANALLDKAVSSHIKHGNYAARQKARLQNAVNNI